MTAGKEMIPFLDKPQRNVSSTEFLTAFFSVKLFRLCGFKKTLP